MGIVDYLLRAFKAFNDKLDFRTLSIEIQYYDNMYRHSPHTHPHAYTPKKH